VKRKRPILDHLFCYVFLNFELRGAGGEDRLMILLSPSGFYFANASFTLDAAVDTAWGGAFVRAAALHGEKGLR